jgi:2-polyprenyl-3-methyl-5-hydroxy-6-metoxy-1,4-benzoquinol methylase
MFDFSQYILSEIERVNPLHGKKIKVNLASFDERYFELSSSFYEKYGTVLKLDKMTIKDAIDCYLRMIANMNMESVDFFRSGKYSSTSFEEVKIRVYDNPEIMVDYLHGLLLSQFLWKHHYGLFCFFLDKLCSYKEISKSYLEIGAGHGLFLSQVLKQFNQDTLFSVVDISQTAIEFAQKFTNDDRVSFTTRNVFEYEPPMKFDFITMGEVLEHVENPMRLLLKVRDLLSEDGVAFISTPTNAPAIDHIYLFESVEEIQSLIHDAGFEIESEKSFLSEDVSKEKAEKWKVSILYGAFIRKKR